MALPLVGGSPWPGGIPRGALLPLPLPGPAETAHVTWEQRSGAAHSVSLRSGDSWRLGDLITGWKVGELGTGLTDEGLHQHPFHLRPWDRSRDVCRVGRKQTCFFSGQGK